MKLKPTILDFRIPEHVYVNMHNGQDYVPVPISNLDEDEVNLLLHNFEKSIRELAGVKFPAQCK